MRRRRATTISLAVALASVPALGAKAEDVGLALRPSVAPAAEALALPPTVSNTKAVRLVKPNRVSRIGALPDVAKPLLPGPSNEQTGSLAEPIEPPALPAKPRLRRAEDDDPYASTGMRAGDFLLYPSINVDFGYSSNPDKVGSGAEGSAFVAIKPALAFEADWSRHALAGSIVFGDERFLSGGRDSRPTLRGAVDGRLDVSADTAIEAGLRLDLDTEDVGTASVPATSNNRPVEATVGASLGVTQRIGPIEALLRTSVDRTTYGDADLAGGGVLSGADRSYNDYGLLLRATYSVTPDLQPFVEASVDRRAYDNAVNASGEERSSTGYALRAGLATANTGILNGQVSVGYGGRLIDDPNLSDLSGLLVDASLVWDASALTRVTARASTTFNETTAAGSSGSIETGGSLELRHAFRRNIVATASIAYSVEDFNGTGRQDDTFEAGLGLEYKFSPSLALLVAASHERLASNVVGADYTENVIRVGLRLQR